MADLKLAIQFQLLQKGFGTFSKLGGGIRGVTGALGGMATAAAALGAIGLAATVNASIDSFTDFEFSMKRVQVVTKGAGDNMEELEGKALSLGKNTFFTAQEVARAMFELGQAGLDATQVLAGIKPVLDLATIGMIGTSEAGEIATDIMTGMGLGVDRLTDVVDILTVAFTSSNTTISALGTGFSKIGPLASTLGIDITELAASMAVLANRGIKGEEAGTALRNIFLRLLNPSSQAESTLASLGLSIEEVTSGTISLEEILAKLGEGLESGAIGIENIAEIFQARATPAVLALIGSLGEGVGSLQSFKAAMEESGGTSQDMLGELENTSKFVFAEFNATIESLKIQLGEGLIPIVMDMIDVFKENEDVIIGLIDRFVEIVPIIISSLAPAAERLVEIFSDLFEKFEEFEILEGIIDVFEALSDAFLQITDALGPFAPLIAVAIAPILGIAFAIGFFSDEIVAIIGFITQLSIGVFNFVTKLAFMIAIVGIGIFKFLEWIGVIKIASNVLGGLLDIAKFVINVIKEIGGAIDELAGGKFGRLFTQAADFSKLSEIDFGFQGGGTVDRTGLALVHAGETIVTAGQTGRGLNGDAGVKIGAININISTSEIDPVTIERKIRKSIDMFRRR